MIIIKYGSTKNGFRKECQALIRKLNYSKPLYNMQWRQGKSREQGLIAKNA